MTFRFFFNRSWMWHILETKFYYRYLSFSFAQKLLKIIHVQHCRFNNFKQTGINCFCVQLKLSLLFLILASFLILSSILPSLLLKWSSNCLFPFKPIITTSIKAKRHCHIISSIYYEHNRNLRYASLH